MTPAESELQWLLTLLKPPYTQGWSAYCEKKAEGLARKYPQEYADLPVMLKAAMRDKDTDISTAESP